MCYSVSVILFAFFMFSILFYEKLLSINLSMKANVQATPCNKGRQPLNFPHTLTLYVLFYGEHSSMYLYVHAKNIVNELFYFKTL